MDPCVLRRVVLSRQPFVWCVSEILYTYYTFYTASPCSECRIRVTTSKVCSNCINIGKRTRNCVLRLIGSGYCTGMRGRRGGVKEGCGVARFVL